MPAAILAADRERARRRFGIAPDDRCLLVFGGSQGARSINLCALDAFVGDGAARSGRDYHVLHIAGQPGLPAGPPAAGGRRRRSSGTRCSSTSRRSADPLAACDLVLARAGGSVFELAAAGRPAILVPYPHATARHQHANAAWMSDGGAALVIEDSELDPAALLRTRRRICSRDAGAAGADVRGVPGPRPPGRGGADRRGGARRGCVRERGDRR